MTGRTRGRARLAAGIWTVLFAAVLAGCAQGPRSAGSTPAPSYASGYFDRAPCADRIGRCFDATIGGQPVEVIATREEFERLRAQLRALDGGVRDVYWTVRRPLGRAAALDVETFANAFGRAHVGEPREEADVTVYALDGQNLESETEHVASPDVRIGGRPAVVQQETLTQDTLPPGRYAFAIKYLGRTNWDRKWVFLSVQ